MPATQSLRPPAALDPISATSPDMLAATLEIVYLREVLESLPADRKSALDVGAHRGDFTHALAELGFRVLAVEPQDYMADRFACRHAELIAAGEVRLARCAASDRPGEAELLIGSASTVSTLEPQWTSVAFPEEFRSTRRVRVPVRTLADLAIEEGFAHCGFAKIDVEGHELPALRGLFAEGVTPPQVVMFEANSRFPEQASQCLDFLQARGYRTFDTFIRIGVDPVAAERFTHTGLPAAWSACGERYFYANIIAYHETLPAPIALPDPVKFTQVYQLDAARNVLARALAHEAAHPVPVHPVWQAARSQLRDYLMHEDWREFLNHPTCRNMFVRGRWGQTQDHELAVLSSSQFGRELLARLRDPLIGAPRLTDRLDGLSTNMLGMLSFLGRIHEQANGRLPREIIEIGGGYGALAWAYLQQAPEAQYVIVDLPEMLAIQHYFLTLAMPNRPVVFATDPAQGAQSPRPGQVTLVPVSALAGAALGCELLISTFAFSEMPRELQRSIEQSGYFGARRLFFTGQLSTEYPDIHLVSHGEVIGAAIQQFPDVRVERFHVGDNYLLLAGRDAARRTEAA